RAWNGTKSAAISRTAAETLKYVCSSRSLQMNNADKHITPWSNTDVQRYLNGELSAREMHDLEQQSLDDPFLADALEGLQTQPVETLNQDIAGLRTRLDNRVAGKAEEKRKMIPWPFL